MRRTGITKVLDVREIPVSRCKGFSKKALEQALSDCGIDYQHERRLGSPRDVRHRLRATGDLQRFLRDFKAHLAGQQDLLDELADNLHGKVALLCYERDSRFCHRMIVARALEKRTGLDTYPQPSQQYEETICCAAITDLSSNQTVELISCLLYTSDAADE